MPPSRGTQHTPRIDEALSRYHQRTGGSPVAAERPPWNAGAARAGAGAGTGAGAGARGRGAHTWAVEELDDYAGQAEAEEEIEEMESVNASRGEPPSQQYHQRQQHQHQRRQEAVAVGRCRLSNRTHIKSA